VPDDPALGAGDSKPAFKPPSLLDALKSLGRGPRAQPASGTEEDRLRVTYIDRRERMIGFFLGGVLAAFAILIFFEFRRYHDKGHPKLTAQAHTAAPEVLIVGLVLGLLILGATVSKRRALLGFGLMLGGLGLFQFGGGIFGLVYLGVGIWMVFRALRKNRPAPAIAGGATSRAASPRTASPRAASPRTARTGRTTTTSKSTTPAPPRVPPASKRYTPPRPQKKAAPARQSAPRRPGTGGANGTGAATGTPGGTGATGGTGTGSTGGSRLTSWFRR
jgi:hypothetical protein